ncbi:uncharacterized protein DUF4342 [Hoeflea marina]|uniref:Uncharacterized protein DUF4342 n=1 Tax=Hoeflea marina TaxID=274592 RepID=A0A317PFF6_9HYPH|nr:DUF4342 domain-containing protein [Hoeflea marina]PWV98795.1 uncharacterized protein DUF4342 [Hoeflea marina]
MKASQSRTDSPDASNPDHEKRPHHERTWTEEIEVTGEQLVATVKRLAAEGQVRRIRLTEPDGDIVLDMPLTIGAIAGGAIMLAAPLLAIIGALAVFVTKVRLEIVRDVPPPSGGTKADAASADDTPSI